ncbi:hypothetical protein E2C01_058160 [Portunus trituberculatus]|uniref:Uncharacterized protein n=1 Tax=Portunus trituberculatus TaxID=210409 RepID=A0A5B7GVM8_PORTR|nr:hypothetical protein [Portunus trituberculatus]
MFGDSIYTSPPGYRAFFSTPFPGQSHRSTAILVRLDIPVVPLQLTRSSLLQVVAVKTFLGRSYTICSLDLPPWVRVSRDDLDGLVRELTPPFFLF